MKKKKNSPDLVLHSKPMSTNAYRTLHWAKQRQVKNEFEWEVIAQVKKNGIEKLVTPLSPRYVFLVEDNRAHDLDNYAINIKFIHDGLRYSGVLKEDTIEYIPKITMEAYRSSCSGIEIYFE